jgi:hypothetical protein
MIKKYVRLSDVAETKAACDRYRALQEQVRASNRRFNALMFMLKERLREGEL